MMLQFSKWFGAAPAGWQDRLAASNDDVVAGCVRALSVQDAGLGLIRLVHVLDALARIGKVKRIVSIGCGLGHHEVLIARLYPDASVVAIDIEPQQFTFSAPNLRQLQGDVLDSRFVASLGKADLVYSIECLEHIEHDQPALAAMCNLIERAGHLYLEVPFANEQERQNPQLRKQEFESFGHWTPGYDADQLRDGARANGLQCLDVKNVFWAPLQPMLWAALERFGPAFIHAQIDRLLPLLNADFRDTMATDRSQAIAIKMLARKPG